MKDNNADFNHYHTDPFLLLDYGQPTNFAPNPNYKTQPHGIGQHPHKGFETVTIAYAGEISHADSAGGYGVIQEGGVKWMTAGRGIKHEEFHLPDFSQRGGHFSMVQLWVNLPSAHKLTEPKYQTLKRDDLPIVNLTDNKDENSIGKAAIIAGEWEDTAGAASTFTPINLWDIALHSAGSTTLQVPNSHNVMILVQEGALLINDTTVSAGSLIQFATPTSTAIDSVNEQAATQISNSIELTCSKLSAPKLSDDEQAPSTVKLLLLSGEPIGEPVAGYGPFVMNTQEELRQTFRDYQTGNFGK
ncbi:pirin family protein [Psychrobacter immobilis]|uniref:pirin family protein n=1 Tax=Psychrobacter immobilis TaxID=498 RepID=UPI0022348D11|nr:pirin family protein [Psychrobacter immobilis]